MHITVLAGRTHGRSARVPNQAALMNKQVAPISSSQVPSAEEAVSN